MKTEIDGETVFFCKAQLHDFLPFQYDRVWSISSEDEIGSIPLFFKELF